MACVAMACVATVLQLACVATCKPAFAMTAQISLRGRLVGGALLELAMLATAAVDLRSHDFAAKQHIHT